MLLEVGMMVILHEWLCRVLQRSFLLQMLIAWICSQLVKIQAAVLKMGELLSLFQYIVKLKPKLNNKKIKGSTRASVMKYSWHYSTYV